jgi:hypothetical protein
MKIELYQEHAKEEPTEVLRLRAQIDEDGDFDVSAIDKDGNAISGGKIFFLSAKSGRLVLMNNCKAPGIQTDSKGQIVVA